MSLGPFKQLQKIAPALIQQTEFTFCICGGLAASLYRKNPRLTIDVDIAISVAPEASAKDKAVAFFSEIGFATSFGWISAPHEGISGKVSIVIGSDSIAHNSATIDLILPVLPWVSAAVKRAQENILDFGFAKLPTITAEDLIISKIFSVTMDPTRYQDLDDIKQIIASGMNLDKQYIKHILDELKLHAPDIFK